MDQREDAYDAVHQDSNDDLDDDDDESLHDHDDGLLSYLFDKSFLKQHIFAIVVAIVATATSYFHIFSDDLKIHTLYPSLHHSKFINMDLTQKKTRKVHLRPTEVHHHHEYTRTDKIKFCPFDDKAIGLSDADVIKNVFLFDENDPQVDKDLQLFYFNFPKEYVDIMNDYYVADEIMDDDYSKILNETTKIKSGNAEFTCLMNSAESTQHRSTVQAANLVFISPRVDSFYKDKIILGNRGLSVMSMTAEDVSRSEHKPVSLTYTGFTSKFVNLSTKPMNLYWDGKNKPRFRSRIDPFESFTTVTSPGNSFFLAPLYDKEYAVKRWVATEDEPLMVYDVITGDDELLETLSEEQKSLYMMQKLNLHYAREYLVKTKRSWLSLFPRSSIFHFMHSAEYFGQEHIIFTKQTHISSLPSGPSGLESVWRRLDFSDYDDMTAKSKLDGPEAALKLLSHRKRGDLQLTLKVVSVTPRVFEIENFLSDVEVDHLIQMAYMHNQTEDFNPKFDSKTASNPRKTSTNTLIQREYSPIVDTIHHRVADALKIDESLLRHRNEHEETGLATHHSISEALMITHYLPGQGYPPISDATQPSVRNRYQPNRFATVLFFLNDLKEGEADTIFPLAVNSFNHDGVRIVPKKGNAVILYNMLPDGNIDDLSQHSSSFLDNSVEGATGEKWLGTLYIWDPIID